MALAVFKMARLIRAGEVGTLFALQAESRSATQPVAWGLLMLVPFINIDFCKHQCETEVMAPPGATTSTPVAPSAAGPTLLHVKVVPYADSASSIGNEYSARIMAGLTYAPTPSALSVVPPGAPTVDRAGCNFQGTRIETKAVNLKAQQPTKRF